MACQHTHRVPIYRQFPPAQKDAYDEIGWFCVSCSVSSVLKKQLAPIADFEAQLAEVQAERDHWHEEFDREWARADVLEAKLAAKDAELATAWGIAGGNKTSIVRMEGLRPEALEFRGNAEAAEERRQFMEYLEAEGPAIASLQGQLADLRAAATNVYENHMAIQNTGDQRTGSVLNTAHWIHMQKLAEVLGRPGLPGDADAAFSELKRIMTNDVTAKQGEVIADLRVQLTAAEERATKAEAKAGLASRFREVLGKRIWVLESCESNMDFQDWLTEWRKEFDALNPGEAQ